MNFSKIISWLKFTYPYILILIVTFIANYFVFFQGINAGDDIRFHLFQITDLIYGIKHGYFGLTTNHVFMGGFAINNYGFYGPVPHYSAAILSIIFGQGAEFGYKATIIIYSFISGVFFYKLARKMSNNIHIGAIAGAMYILMPYRIFCAVCRCAFAEVVAICAIPMIFYGAYSIVHDDEYRVWPYISLVIGAAIIIMSHPFTGLIIAIFGVLYLAFNIMRLIRKKKFIIYPSLIASALLIFCLVGFYVFNALATKNAGIYRLNDPIIDWTNYDHVAGSTGLSSQFSGILNFIYISNNSGTPGWNVENVSSIVLSIIVFIAAIANSIIADELIKKAPKNIYYRWAVNGIALFMFPIIFGVRLEVFLACIIFFITYNVFSYLSMHEKDEDDVEFKSIKTNPDLYFLIASILILFIFIYTPTAWKYVPDIFYQSQFAWRLWGPQMFFIGMLLTLLVSYAKKYKAVIISFASFASLLVCLSQGLIEKRIAYTNGGLIYENVNEVTLTESIEAKYSGAQNEMVPLVLMDPEYESEYENSLYYDVRYALTYWNSKKNHFIYTIEDYQNYGPVFLEGDGEIEITKYNTPNNTFEAEITSESALIQFPQIYNVGYEIYSQGTYLGEAKNIDGLIAFELPKGEYTLDLVFKNSKPYQVFRPFFYIGLASLIPFAVLGVLYQKKIEKREKEES